ncbi:MAG: hypothetical protein AVDCRST_MAG70-461, partial [uncultured Thermomicrobiales bacterium]
GVRCPGPVCARDACHGPAVTARDPGSHLFPDGKPQPDAEYHTDQSSRRL